MKPKKKSPDKVTYTHFKWESGQKLILHFPGISSGYFLVAANKNKKEFHVMLLQEALKLK